MHGTTSIITLWDTRKKNSMYQYIGFDAESLKVRYCVSNGLQWMEIAITNTTRHGIINMKTDTRMDGGPMRNI
jgi:transposase-like protein